MGISVLSPHLKAGWAQNSVPLRNHLFYSLGVLGLNDVSAWLTCCQEELCVSTRYIVLLLLGGRFQVTGSSGTVSYAVLRSRHELFGWPRLIQRCSVL